MIVKLSDKVAVNTEHVSCMTYNNKNNKTVIFFYGGSYEEVEMTIGEIIAKMEEA